MTALLELDGIGKTYELERRLLPRIFGASRPLEAVKNVSLRVERGGVLGLVGESGCGKSTLAQIIMRLERQTSGTIRFDGTDITALEGRALQPFRRRFQMVFQELNGLAQSAQDRSAHARRKPHAGRRAQGRRRPCPRPNCWSRSGSIAVSPNAIRISSPADSASALRLHGRSR